MTPVRAWRYDEIHPGMILTADKLEQGGIDEPLLYRVVAIIDEPTVVLEPVYRFQGDERETYPLSSDELARFRQVRAADRAGKYVIHYVEEEPT